MRRHVHAGVGFVIIIIITITPRNCNRAKFITHGGAGGWGCTRG